MAPATTTTANNWLSFSLSPMLRSASESPHHHFMSYEEASTAPVPHHHYLLDNFYANNAWVCSKDPQVLATTTMAETSILTSHVPKLEDFLGDSSSMVRYSDNSQTETQDSSSLTHIYDHSSAATAAYFNDHQDLKAMTAMDEVFHGAVE